MSVTGMICLRLRQAQRVAGAAALTVLVIELPFVTRTGGRAVAFPQTDTLTLDTTVAELSHRCRLGLETTPPDRHSGSTPSNWQ